MGGVQLLVRVFLLEEREATYKMPRPNIAITEPLTRQSSCTSQRRKMGSVAKIQSVVMDTTATA